MHIINRKARVFKIKTFEFHSRLQITMLLVSLIIIMKSYGQYKQNLRDY